MKIRQAYTEIWKKEDKGRKQMFSWLDKMGKYTWITEKKKQTNKQKNQQPSIKIPFSRTHVLRQEHMYA